MELKKYRLGELCKIASSKRIFESEYVDSGIPFVRGLEISDGRLFEPNAKFDCYISRERYKELKAKYGIPVAGDILITAVGTIGNLAYLPKNIEFYFKDGNLIWFSEFSKLVYSKYLYFFMKSPFFYRQVNYSLIGAVQKALTMDLLKKIEIPLPDFPTQKKIADVLSCIDDKIALNNKTNAELENMAKTVYDYWFTQFDFPDKNGNPYKSSGGKMVYNEILKREIPEGWKDCIFNDYVERITNGLNPRKNFVLGSGSNYYVTIRSLLDNDINWDNCDKCDNEALAKINARSQLQIGDVIFSAIGTVGRTYRIYEEPKDWNISETSFTIRPKKNVPQDFFYSLLRSPEFQKQADHKAMGSTLRCLVMDSFCEIPCVLVPRSISEQYSEFVQPLYKTIYDNNKQNRELTKLRDYLLPLLMNGQIEVK